MTGITAAGFSRTRLDERVAELNAKMQAIFGPSINLDPDTIDGQTIGAVAEFISSLDQLAEEVYASFNPQTAAGAALSRLVQLNGIRRIPGAYTTVDLLCVGSQDTTIPAGSLARDPNTGFQVETLEDVLIGAAGEILVPARALLKGAYTAATGTITKIDTPIYGWQSVTNPSDAVPGRDEETDEQLRVRRRLSTSTPAQGILDAVRGALLNIPDVRQAVVYENDTDAVDAHGLLPHSMYAVVEGGADTDIGNVLWLKKSTGCTLKGTTTVTIQDSMSNPHVMKFDRPTDVNVYVIVNLTKKPGWPTDGVNRIKTAIVAWALENQKIGGDVIQSGIYNPVNTVPGISVQSIYIGTAAGPTTTTDITVAFNALARFDTSRITVNAA